MGFQNPSGLLNSPFTEPVESLDAVVQPAQVGFGELRLPAPPAHVVEDLAHGIDGHAGARGPTRSSPFASLRTWPMKPLSGKMPAR